MRAGATPQLQVSGLLTAVVPLLGEQGLEALQASGSGAQNQQLWGTGSAAPGSVGPSGPGF